MDVNLRPAVAADAQECGRICHDAFASIATRHGFTSDFPSVEVAVSIVSGLIAHPKFYSVVAELNGRIVGSNFLDERSTIVGVGPITVDPEVQDRQVGRALLTISTHATRSAFAFMATTETESCAMQYLRLLPEWSSVVDVSPATPPRSRSADTPLLRRTMTFRPSLEARKVSAPQGSSCRYATPSSCAGASRMTFASSTS